MAADDPSRGGLNPFAAPRTDDDPAQVSVADVREQYRSLKPYATAVVAALGLVVLGSAAELMGVWRLWDYLRSVESGMEPDEAVASALDARADAVALLDAAANLLAVIAFCLLIPRANRNARAFVPHALSFTPRWAAGVFFVPVWNFYKPYRALKEIFQISDPRPKDPSLPAFLRPVPTLLGWWWAGYIGMGITWQVSQRTSQAASHSPDFVGAAIVFETIDAIVTIGAAGMAAGLVWLLARWQHERAAS